MRAHLELLVKWKNRHSVLTVLFLGYLLCYMDRMFFATALPFIAQELQLSSLAIGAVMSAFFVGYAIMQIPRAACRQIRADARP